MRPFLFKDRHEDEVELVEQSAFAFKLLLRIRILDDKIDDEIADAYETAS